MSRPGLVLTREDILDLWLAGDLSNAAFTEYCNRIEAVQDTDQGEAPEWGIWGNRLDRAVMGAAFVLLFALLAYTMTGWWLE